MAGTLAQVAGTWNDARDAGHALTLLNIGGFPPYGEDVDGPTDYGAAAVMEQVRAFGDVPHVMAGPAAAWWPMRA